jgi:hypothetical protein
VIDARRGARIAAVALVLVAATVGAVELPVPGTTGKVDASGYLDGLAVAEIGGPRQRPQAIGELRLLGRVMPQLRLQLTLRGRVGGPFEGGHPGIMNFVHEFQNRTPSLEFNEAYGELRLGDAQLRAGIQKFAWGKLDGLPPTDVLTPRDLHDPLVRDVEESKIGIPALSGTYFLPPVDALGLSELRAQLVYIPFAVPSRLALAAERWFPPSVIARRVIRLSADDVEAAFGFPRGARIPITFRTLNNAPSHSIVDGGIAFRLGGTWREMDWDVYHYTGPETGPNADLVVSVKGEEIDPKILAPADVHLRQEHDTIHMTGADWSTALGGATVRAEAAFFLDRPYLRISSDLFTPEALSQIPKMRADRIFNRVFMLKRARVPLQELFPDRDSVEWGVGADYLIEGFLPLVQVNQVVFTDGGPEQLYSDPETRILGSVKKKILADTLELELRGVYAIERAAWFVYPRATYRLGDHWRFRLGYLAPGGPLDSYIGQFHRNDEFTLEARYGF